MKIFNEEDIGKSFKITVSNSMGSDEVTVNVKNIVDLIIEPPAKTTYQLFDDLELDGLRVYGVYDDNTIEELFNYIVDESDFNTHILDKPICNIKISYGIIEKSFNVSVLEEIGVNGDNYAFITEWNAFDGVFSMGNGNFKDKYIVDWGDGVTQRFNGTIACSHTYSVSEPRFIKFYFNKYDLGMRGRTNLKRVLNWNENPSRYYFYSCSNLLSLPENQSMKIPDNISDINLMFYDCSSLVDIPEKLFDNISFIKVTRISSIFGKCLSLNSVPNKLFRNFVNLNYAVDAFSGSGIVSVGDDLFCNSLLLLDAYGIFRNCTNLETVGINLFNNSPNLNCVYHCFNNCTKLKSVGDGFVNSIDLRSFYGCFYNTIVEHLPVDLFNRAYLIQDGYELEYSFENSLSTNTVIPERFFENLLWLNTAKYIFRRSKISSVPKNMFNENISLSSAEYLFYDSDIKDVGEDIFKGCTRLQSIQGCFYNCHLLENLHQLIFKSCKNVTNIDYCFYQCASVIDFPDFLFFNQNKLKACYRVFYGCEALLKTPKFLFCYSIEKVNNMFSDCINLINFQKETFELAFRLIEFTGSFNLKKLTFLSKEIFKNCLKLRLLEFIFNADMNWKCDLEDGIFDNNVELENVSIKYKSDVNTTAIGFVYSQELFKNNFLINKLLLTVVNSNLSKHLLEKLILLKYFYVDTETTESFELPQDLIEENINLENFSFTGIETLSPTFLEKNIELKYFNTRGSLKLIPSGLFNNNIKLEAVDFSLTEIVSIPTNLFDNNINLKSFRFSDCRKLITIPENLFINNINLEDCTYGFYNCKNLALPINLFNAAAIQSKKPEFYSCFSVVNSTDSPTGAPYPFWNDITLSSRNYCYQNCSSLSNFATIPLYWK